MKPKKYNMMLHKEVRRWFDEMEGYLRTGDFVHQGTDLEGRRYALEGFYILKDTILNNQHILTQIVESVNYFNKENINEMEYIH